MIAGVFFLSVNWFDVLWIRVICLSAGIFFVGIFSGITLKASELYYINKRLLDEPQ